MITTITGPANEPVTVEEAKDFLRLDTTDEDYIVDRLILAAREWMEDKAGLVLMTQTRELILDEWPDADIMEIPCYPIATISSVKYKDEDGTETTWAAANYIVDAESIPPRLSLAYSIEWPTATLLPINAIRVRFTCGYASAAAIPQRVKQVLMQHVHLNYDHRLPDEDAEKALLCLLGDYRLLNF